MDLLELEPAEEEAEFLAELDSDENFDSQPNENIFNPAPSLGDELSLDKSRVDAQAPNPPPAPHEVQGVTEIRQELLIDEIFKDAGLLEEVFGEGTQTRHSSPFPSELPLDFNTSAPRRPANHNFIPRSMPIKRRFAPTGKEISVGEVEDKDFWRFTNKNCGFNDATNGALSSDEEENYQDFLQKQCLPWQMRTENSEPEIDQLLSTSNMDIPLWKQPQTTPRLLSDGFTLPAPENYKIPRNHISFSPPRPNKGIRDVALIRERPLSYAVPTKQRELPPVRSEKSNDVQDDHFSQEEMEARLEKTPPASPSPSHGDRVWTPEEEFLLTSPTAKRPRCQPLSPISKADANEILDSTCPLKQNSTTEHQDLSLLLKNQITKAFAYIFEPNDPDLEIKPNYLQFKELRHECTNCECKKSTKDSSPITVNVFSSITFWIPKKDVSYIKKEEEKVELPNIKNEKSLIQKIVSPQKDKIPIIMIDSDTEPEEETENPQAPLTLDSDSEVEILGSPIIAKSSDKSNLLKEIGMLPLPATADKDLTSRIKGYTKICLQTTVFEGSNSDRFQAYTIQESTFHQFLALDPKLKLTPRVDLCRSKCCPLVNKKSDTKTKCREVLQLEKMEVSLKWPSGRTRSSKTSQTLKEKELLKTNDASEIHNKTDNYKKHQLDRAFKRGLPKPFRNHKISIIKKDSLCVESSLRSPTHSNNLNSDARAASSNVVSYSQSKPKSDKTSTSSLKTLSKSVKTSNQQDIRVIEHEDDIFEEVPRDPLAIFSENLEDDSDHEGTLRIDTTDESETAQNLEPEIKIEHNQKKSNSQVIITSSLDKCDFCSDQVIYDDASLLKEHIQQIHPFRCKFCFLDFKDADERYTHLIHCVEYMKGRKVCSFCETIRFDKPISKERHENTKHHKKLRRLTNDAYWKGVNDMGNKYRKYGLYIDPLHATQDTELGHALDASPDPSRDASLEAPRDASLEAPRDASLEAPRDASLEAPRDASSDVSRDPPRNASLDCATDVALNSALNTALETTLNSTQFTELNAMNQTEQESNHITTNDSVIVNMNSVEVLLPDFASGFREFDYNL